MLDESRAKLDKTLAEADTLEKEEELRRKARLGSIYKPEHATYLLAELDRRERLRASASSDEQMAINRSAAAAARDAADAAREANRHAKRANAISMIAIVIAILAIIVSAVVAVAGGT